MKKFFIVYKDGSQQTLMPAIHDTRKKAEETLMDYIHHHNKRSDCWLSVFDFTIEEEDSGVSSFEEAKQIVGSANFVLASQSLPFSDIELKKEQNPANASGSVSACFGFRLCFKTQERAEQFGRQFVNLYNQVFLL